MNLILLGGPERERYVLEAWDSRAKHVRAHLKKRQGSLVRVGFIGGRMGEAEVRYEAAAVTLRVLPETLRAPGPRPRIHVLIGMPYPKVAKALWSVLSSLGVAAITYAPAALSEPEYAKSSAFERGVYEPLLLQGLAQAEDTRLPLVQVLPDLAAALASLPDGCRIALHVQNHDGASIRRRFRDWRQLRPDDDAAVVLAIGPERGWTDDELLALAAHRFRLASLGDPILRTDTAVVAALALARDVLLDDDDDAHCPAVPPHR